MKQFLTLTVAILLALVATPAHTQGVSAEQKKTLLQLQAKYTTEIYQAVISQIASIPWRNNGTCIVELTQIPTGEVIRATTLECDFPNEIQQQLAVQLQSAKLPYSGFESVFQRKIKIKLD